MKDVDDKVSTSVIVMNLRCSTLNKNAYCQNIFEYFCKTSILKLNIKKIKKKKKEKQNSTKTQEVVKDNDIESFPSG